MRGAGVGAGPVALPPSPPHPASAAGPDLRQLILGSEGRFGIITEATLRVRRQPRYRHYEGLLFPDEERATLDLLEDIHNRLGFRLSLDHLARVEEAVRLKEAGQASEIVVVSGLPRSGTSMMMQMLEAGGITADPFNFMRLGNGQAQPRTNPVPAGENGIAHGGRQSLGTTGAGRLVQCSLDGPLDTGVRTMLRFAHVKRYCQLNLSPIHVR